MDERAEAQKLLQEYGSLHAIAHDALEQLQDISVSDFDITRYLRTVRLLRALTYLTPGAQPVVLSTNRLTAPNRW